MTNQEIAYTEIQRLVTDFKNLTAQQRKSMNEMQTRLGYILPLFKALGWDTSNINEVSPEEKVSRGWVDFSFRIGNVPRYFLETKKVHEDLNDPRWVKQAIDYAWTKSVTWALLSDFEGLRVFNAEWKESDPFRAQFFEFGLDDYLKDFERLWWLSKEETVVRRLDVEAEKVGKKIKRLPVSQNLFDDLKRWRENLFKNYKAFNLGYSAAQIDEAVLRLLNRLIFVRTAEDREVEENRLQSLVRVLKDKKQLPTLDRELANLFRELDGVYNSELFARHFSEELQIPPTELEEIINGLYQKDYVRYNFNALEADVLGTAYEQYLGHIVAEGENETHVEEKRTKRKSQGIYYTPTFVTKYIVQQTVGKYLEENGYNPSKPPRVLDMACGSGSFLIEAFDVIDNFVAKQRGQAQKGEVDFYDRARQLEVLQNCIFGVDKDKQAVEVARLNLLLRGLHSREKLPMLENIANADSLKSDTYPFHFPKIKKEGGFDLIVGNPPYIRGRSLDLAYKEQLLAEILTFTPNADIYIAFLGRAFELLKPNGILSFIIPRSFLNETYAKKIRLEFLKNSEIVEVVDFQGIKVFEEATVTNVILVIKKKDSSGEIPIRHWQDEKWQKLSVENVLKSADASIRPELVGVTPVIIDKSRQHAILAGDICYVSYSVAAHSEVEGKKKDAYIFNQKKNKKCKRFVEARELSRYKIDYLGRWLEYDPKIVRRPGLPELFESPKIMVRDVVGQQGLICSYDDSGFYADYSVVCLTLKSNLKNVASRRITFTEDELTIAEQYSIFYVLGLLNSSLMKFIFKMAIGGGLHVYPDNIRQLPICKINFSNSAEKEAYDEIVKLVEKMLALQKERQSVRPEDDLDHARNLDRQIKEVDSEIDEKVYNLYGLTDEEKKIIETSLSKT
ncbi:MAG: N-6 DNA methylase [Anaerolineales bacterium]|nr:MAG: N-6 DNA methylase [Anaerolineales bacterium]